MQDSPFEGSLPIHVCSDPANERLSNPTISARSQEEDLSYAKSSLGPHPKGEGQSQRILGVQWNPNKDELIFDAREVAKRIELMEPTKRSIVGVTARIFDPLGVLSPVTVKFKCSSREESISACRAEEGMGAPSEDV